MASTTARQSLTSRNIPLLYRYQHRLSIHNASLLQQYKEIQTRNFTIFRPTLKSSLPYPFFHHRLLGDITSNTSSASCSNNNNSFSNNGGDSALQLLSTYPLGSTSDEEENAILKEQLLKRKKEIDELYQNATSYSELNEAALAYAQELNDPTQAHDILQKLEIQYPSESHNLQQTLTATMKANVTCQEELYERLRQWNDDFPDNSNALQDQQGEEYTLVRQCLGEILRFAERADWILCKLEESLVRLASSDLKETNDGDNESISEKETATGLQPTSFHYNSVISTFKTVILASALPLSLSSGWTLEKGIPQRSTLHLQTMERFNNSTTPIKNIQPSIDTYNDVLETWTMSQESHFSAMAESIFKRLNTTDNTSSSNDSDSPMTDTHTLKTNARTFQIMIRAWCRWMSLPRDVLESSSSSSQIPNKRNMSAAAFNASGHLMRMQKSLESGKDEFEPSLEDYHLVLKAWAQNNNSAKRSLNILKKMEDLYRDGLTTVRPDLECYKHILVALSKSHSSKDSELDLGKEVDLIIFKINEQSITIDTECFRAAIETYCNSARYPSTSSSTSRGKTIHHNASRANDYLNDMSEMYYRSSLIVVKPSTVDYNNILQAWSQSNMDGAAQNAEIRLSEMEKQWRDGNEQIQPNTSSYLYTITAWKNSQQSLITKVDAIMSLLNRMTDQYEEGNSGCRPTIQVYNLLIATCGGSSANRSNENDKKKILKTSINIYKMIRETDYVQCTSKTFELLLSTTGKLLSVDSPELSKTDESIFSQCIADGLVDDNVLRKFEKVVPHDVYRCKVMLNAVPWTAEAEGNVSLYTSHMSNDLILPLDWTRNIRGGRNIVSISVDNKFLNQRRRSFQERKMRRMRSKKNQKLLQGGRMAMSGIMYEECVVRRIRSCYKEGGWQ